MSSSFEVTYPKIKVDINGKIKLIRFGDPYAAPGSCIICGVTLDQGKYFIDFGMNIEFHGAVYFCNVCIAQAMEVFGYYHESSVEWRRLNMNNVQLSREKEVLENRVRELEGYRNVINDLSNLLSCFNFTASVVNDFSGEKKQSSSTEVLPRTVISIRKDDRDKRGTEFKVDKPVDEQGSANILDITGIDSEIADSLGNL